MIIHLNEISKDGESFSFSSRDQKMASALTDLLGNQKFNANVYIQPLGDAFDIVGKIETKLPLTCSFCAEEFLMDITANLREVAIVKTKAKISFSGHHLEDADYRELTSFDYDAAEFLHELVALNQPIQPRCSDKCKGLCPSCGINRNNETCCCTEQKNDKPSAFSVLKNLKLN